MVELGTRRTTERVRDGHSLPTAARAVFLPDALNLQHSSENKEFWDSADPLVLGAGHAASTL